MSISIDSQSKIKLNLLSLGVISMLEMLKLSSKFLTILYIIVIT